MAKHLLNLRPFPFLRESAQQKSPGGRDCCLLAGSRTFNSPVRSLYLTLLLLTLAGGLRNNPATASVAEPAATNSAAQIQTNNRIIGHTVGWPAHWIGVEVERIPPVFSSLLGLQLNQGLLVLGVVPSSPAGHAGLRPGDLLYELNGRPLLLPNQLIHAANAHRGNKAAPCKLEFIRQGKRTAVTINPLPRPALPSVQPAGGLNGTAATPQTAMRTAGPTSLDRMVPGPGILVRLGGNAVQNEALPRFFSVTQWTQKNGQLQTMHISTQGKIYAVDMAHLDKLPPRIAMLARIFNRMHQNATAVQAAAGQQLINAGAVRQPNQPMTILEAQRLNLVRQIALLSADIQNLTAVRRQLVPMHATLQAPSAAGTVPAPDANRYFERKLMDAQIAGLTAQRACLTKYLAQLTVKNSPAHKK